MHTALICTRHVVQSEQRGQHNLSTIRVTAIVRALCTVCIFYYCMGCISYYHTQQMFLVLCSLEVILFSSSSLVSLRMHQYHKPQVFDYVFDYDESVCILAPLLYASCGSAVFMRSCVSAAIFERCQVILVQMKTSYTELCLQCLVTVHYCKFELPLILSSYLLTMVSDSGMRGLKNIQVDKIASSVMASCVS